MRSTLGLSTSVGSAFRAGSALLAGTAIAASLWATPAVAGGVGLLTTGGLYSQRVAFYPRDEAGNVAAAPEFSRQGIGTVGTGFEMLLGDRDDRILGMARAWWQLETPESDPTDGTNAISAWREDVRHVGSFAVGLQFGLVGSPDKGQLVVQGLVGSGFMTNDHTEFIMADLGVGGTLRVARAVELYGVGYAHLRYRKGARGGGNVVAGVRYLFD
jgi:hypothetical protein